MHMIGRLVKSEEDKEELCQDVFIRVYNKLESFSFNSKLSTWIATIAYRYAINHIRKNKIAYTDISDNIDSNSNFISDQNTEASFEEQDLDNYVLKLVDQLPAQYKIILTLYHLEGMTYPEICQITDMPEGTVKNYLFRARTMLKEKVKKHLGKEELL